MTTVSPLLEPLLADDDVREIMVNGPEGEFVGS